MVNQKKKKEKGKVKLSGKIKLHLHTQCQPNGSECIPVPLWIILIGSRCSMYVKDLGKVKLREQSSYIYVYNLSDNSMAVNTYINIVVYLLMEST